MRGLIVVCVMLALLAGCGRNRNPYLVGPHPNERNVTDYSPRWITEVHGEMTDTQRAIIKQCIQRLPGLAKQFGDLNGLTVVNQCAWRVEVFERTSDLSAGFGHQEYCEAGFLDENGKEVKVRQVVVGLCDIKKRRIGLARHMKNTAGDWIPESDQDFRNTVIHEFQHLLFADRTHLHTHAFIDFCLMRLGPLQE